MGSVGGWVCVLDVSVGSFYRKGREGKGSAHSYVLALSRVTFNRIIFCLGGH